MKKKILLIIMMFMFITNVNALTFNVDVTNIEDKGNNGTIGSITRIDVPNKTLDAEFSNIGDEVSFSITVTNTGDRAGTLRSIDITSINDKIEYSSNLPEGGLAINGNDTNEVIVTAKVKDGAVNGTSTSTIKIKYTYDEGSCPEGEILSEDESMCLCPEGKVRNELGICIEPPKPIECEEDEIYNEEKKICEKKVVPVDPDDPVEPEPTPHKEDVKPTPINPSNPKTLDNIILITLLFFVSGLGIYAVMFKKLDTNKKKISAGVTLGVVTFTLSFTVLAGVFGLDNLLSAIVNPITKSKEIIVTVNEKIDMIEVWDGVCELEEYDNLIPENIFEGGSGTESDPYTIKTAKQLGCFAKSVNTGSSYDGQFIKQIKNIKLNDNLIEKADAGNFDVNTWTSIGDTYNYYFFGGTYDGDNHTISGMYINNYSMSGGSKGLFGYTNNDATIKNLVLSDVYIATTNVNVGGLVGKAEGNITIQNVKTYGKVGEDQWGLSLPSEYDFNNHDDGGILGKYNGSGNGRVVIEDCENNINPMASGIFGNIENIGKSDEPNIIIRNVINNSQFTTGGIGGTISDYTYDGANVLVENAVNNGIYNNSRSYTQAGGLFSGMRVQNIKIINSGNTGNLTDTEGGVLGGIAGQIGVYPGNLLIDGCYNSGNIINNFENSYSEGLTNSQMSSIRDDNPTSDTAGLVATIIINQDSTATITNSYNTGTLASVHDIGGLVQEHLSFDSWGGTLTNNITFDNCYNTGDILVGSGRAGGIIAVTKGTIKNSYNTGNITIWGFDDPYSETSESIHYGQLSGGLVGSGVNTTLTTDTVGATIINSYNTGNIMITSKTEKVTGGGICGFCGDITDSHNSGNITSKYAQNLFDGLSFKHGAVTNSYFDGEITAENLPY